MTPPESAAAPDASRRYMVPGLAAGHATFHWIIQSVAVILPEIQAYFMLTSVGAAGIMSAREVAAGLIALPGGVVTDIVRRHWGLLLAGCLAVAALGSLALGLSPVYTLLLIGIGAVAIAHSIWHLPASASLSHHFAARRGTALAFHGVGGSIGDVAGPLATGAMLAYLGWRGLISVYGLYAVVTLAMGLAAIWAFRHIGRVDTAAGAPPESPRTPATYPPVSRPGETASGTSPESPTLARRIEMTRRLLRRPVLWGLTFVRGLRSMCLVSLVTVLPLYLGDDLEIGPLGRSVHLSLLIVVGLLAKPLAGNLSDRWGRKQVLVPGLLWSALAAVLMAVFDRGAALMVMVSLMGLFLYPDQPILTAAVFDVIGREVASTGLGVVASAAFLMSAASALIAGAIYDTMGFAAAMYYIAALFVLAAAVFAILPLSRPAGGPGPG